MELQISEIIEYIFHAICRFTGPIAVVRRRSVRLPVCPSTPLTRQSMSGFFQTWWDVFHIKKKIVLNLFIIFEFTNFLNKISQNLSNNFFSI